METKTNELILSELIKINNEIADLKRRMDRMETRSILKVSAYNKDSSPSDFAKKMATLDFGNKNKIS